jgi:hypothetical protein
MMKGIISQPASRPIIGNTRTIPPAVPFTNARVDIQSRMIKYLFFSLYLKILLLLFYS